MGPKPRFLRLQRRLTLVLNSAFSYWGVHHDIFANFEILCPTRRLSPSLSLDVLFGRRSKRPMISNRLCSTFQEENKDCSRFSSSSSSSRSQALGPSCVTCGGRSKVTPSSISCTDCWNKCTSLKEISR